MIIEKNKKKEKRLEIDLTGPQGNAFYLLGIASSLARNMGKEDKEIQAILNGMKSGNYEHLLEVFEKN